MRKPIISFIVVALLVSILLTPGGGVRAQGITVPAEINKSFSPISIPSGGTSRLSVTIFNPNDNPLTNASWTDNLNSIQPGLRIADPPSVNNSCGGTVNASAGGTSFSLSGGTVPAQSGSTVGRCTVSLNITSTTVGNLINRIPSGALSGTVDGETVSNTDPASATLNVTGTPTPPPTPPPPPPVTLSKNFNPGSIGIGGISQLSIVIRNNQTNASLTQASVTDNLPANVFLASPPNPQLTNCGPSASVTAVSGGTSVTLNNGTIAPSSTCTIIVNVTSNVQGTHTNRIPAGSLRTQENLSNPTDATDRLTVRAIDITKAFDPGEMAPGGISTLTITLVNPTGTAYTGARFTDNLPSPLVVAPNATITNTCGGTLSAAANSPTIALTGGVIPAGTPAAPGTCSISVQVTVPAGTTSQRLTNSIPRGGLTTDQGVSNTRAANDSITVRGSDSTATKSFSPATMTVGENSRLRIDVFAPGDTNLTNFTITDSLPTNVTISNSTAASTNGCGNAAVLTATTGTSTISLTGGLILAGTRCRITVYVTSSTPGTYTNTIPPENITNTENRVPGAPITSNLTVNPTAPTNLSIALVKGFDPLIVTGGAASTMSIQLINPDTTPLTGIAFTDDMPDGMILATPVNFNVGTCGGTLTGLPGDGAFSYSGGSLPALGSCTLTLSATMMVNGNLTNIIPARSVTTTNGATNADPAEASLTNLPGASVSKDFAPNPIPANSISLLTITILNTGNIELVQMGMSDSLPTGLLIAGSPAPVNNCGGTLTAVPGTQLIELTGGTLAGNSSCTIVVPITGSVPGDYQNTIPVGGLVADPNTRNTAPATATLTITGGPPPPNTGVGGTPTNPPTTGGGQPDSPAARAATNNAFLIPVTGFKAHVETDLSQVPQETYMATGDVTLEIPSLKVKIPVVGVPKKNGTWNVAWLGNAAGWLEGSAFPSWKGNSVLTSHVYLANGLPGPFVNLNQLKFGDKVYVYAYGEKYTFEVQTNAVVAPTDRSVMKHEDKPWLTLITCKDYDEKTDTYKQRVVVRAVLVEVSAVK